MAAKTVLVYENINFLIIDNELKQVNHWGSNTLFLK